MATIRRFAGPVIAFLIGSGLEVSGVENMRLAISIWFVAGAWLVVAVATWEPVQRRLTYLLVERPTFRKQPNPPSGIEFYPDRPSMVKARGGLKKELESVYVAWAAWYAGTHAAAEEVFESTHKPQKLILLNPDGKYAPIVGDLFRRPLEQLRRDIETTRDKALAAGIKTYLFDGPMELMVIGEPESGNGWVRVEIAIPGSAVRPNIVIRQTDYPELFQQFVQAYKTMLSHHETVSFVGQ